MHAVHSGGERVQEPVGGDDYGGTGDGFAPHPCPRQCHRLQPRHPGPPLPFDADRDTEDDREADPGEQLDGQHDIDLPARASAARRGHAASRT
jgi:hypothetical protein